MEKKTAELNEIDYLKERSINQNSKNNVQNSQLKIFEIEKLK